MASDGLSPSVLAVPTHGRAGTIELSVPRSLAAPGGSAHEAEHAGAEDGAAEHEVVGRLRGAIPEASSVKALVKSLRDGQLEEFVVAESPVDAAGWYRLRYDPEAVPAGAGDTSLCVQLHAHGDADPIAQSTAVLSPPPRTRIDLRVPRVASTPSEYAELERQITEDLESGAGALEGADERVIGEVADWLDVDPERLMLFQEARSLGQQTGVPAPVFYALGRDGSVPTLDELLGVPIYELRTAIEEAAADGVIDLEPLGDVHAVVDRLAAQIVEHATQAAPDGSGLGDVLAASGIQPEIISEVLYRVPGADRERIGVLGINR